MKSKDIEYSQEEVHFTELVLERFFKDKTLSSIQISNNFISIALCRNSEVKNNIKIGFGVDAVGEDNEDKDEIEEDEEE